MIDTGTHRTRREFILSDYQNLISNIAIAPSEYTLPEITHLSPLTRNMVKAAIALLVIPAIILDHFLLETLLFVRRSCTNVLV